MPKGKGPKSSPTPTEGGALPPVPPAGSPPGAPNPPAAIFDVSKYRRAATAPGGAAGKGELTEAEKQRRAQRPKVKWDALAGVDGFSVVDVWVDESDEYGEYVGAVVRAPDGAEAVALANSNTQAGRSLMRAINAGKLDDLDGSAAHGVAFHATARKAPSHPDGRPMVRITFG